MATNLTIRLANLPGTLAEAADVLGRAGTNIEGASGYVCETGQGVFNVLVSDPVQARRALMDSGFDIEAERRVALAPVENTPGSGARILRRIADAGVNIELLYLAADGRLVLAGDDTHALEAALA
ncbi:MAG TPA: hypothetical protein VFY23_02610 [Candidatus Limnocylindrales bacterium]|nr:hypothetical protein [Candidatus Limnocylindrales bacterium]